MVAVTGDTVNVAARVMGSAAPGQLLATRAALEWAAHIFDATPLASFAVRGRSEPVRAAVVRGPIAIVPERAHDASLFVGREAELALILEAARCAAAGDGEGAQHHRPGGHGQVTAAR